MYSCPKAHGVARELLRTAALNWDVERYRIDTLLFNGLAAEAALSGWVVCRANDDHRGGRLTHRA
jgi:hypothetical protein